MGKASRLKAAARATRFVVRVGYSDGSEDANGFATKEQAMRLVDQVASLVDSDDGVDLVELVECSTGAVEFRAVKQRGLGVLNG